MDTDQDFRAGVPASALSTNQQIVLLALLVELVPTKFERIYDILARAGIKSEIGKAFSRNLVGTIFGELVNKGFLVEPEPRFFWCLPENAENAIDELSVLRKAELKTLLHVSENSNYYSYDGITSSLFSSLFRALVDNAKLRALEFSTRLVQFLRYRAILADRKDALALCHIIRFVIRKNLMALVDEDFITEGTKILSLFTVTEGITFGLTAELIIDSKPSNPVELAAIELLAVQTLVRGTVGKLCELPPPTRKECVDKTTLFTARALALLLSGKESEADAAFSFILDAFPAKSANENRYFIPCILYPFHALYALSREKAPTAKLNSWAKDKFPHFGNPALILWSMFRHAGKADASSSVEKDLHKLETTSKLDIWLCALAFHANEHLDHSQFGAVVPGLRVFFGKSGCAWYELELASIDATRKGSAPNLPTEIAKLKEKTGITNPLFSLLSSRNTWEAQLKRLKSLKLSANKAEIDVESDCIAWSFDPSVPQVIPMLRKRLKNGDWSTPRAAPLTRLARKDHPAILPHDHGALKAIKDNYYGIYIDQKIAIEALAKAEHPYVYLDESPDTPVELTAEDLQLIVDESGGSISFHFAADPGQETVILTKTGPSAWKVSIASDSVKKVAEVIGKKLTVPQQARGDVLEILGKLAAGMRISSPLVQENKNATTVEADFKPVVMLVPYGLGLRIDIHVRPLGKTGPIFNPGQGILNPHTSLGKDLYVTTRSLESEKNAFTEMAQNCPILATWLNGSFSAEIEDNLACLEILAELRDVASTITVEWPKGGRIGLKNRIGVKSGRFKIHAERNWFSLAGSVQVDEDTLLTLKELLALSKTAQGRFVQLASGDFVEIEAQFLKQIEHLASTAEVGKDSVKVHPLGLLSSDLLMNPEYSKTDDKIVSLFRDRVAQIANTHHEVPSGLSAELRPYQEEGFQWMARLADIDAGACLADDMGLGKTIQCIALLNHRAALGPSLVVAPASVGANWIAEITRFSTVLQPVFFSELDRSARAEVVGNLTARQVLVATYGLLVSEEELFASRNWNVVVLDEAHAIKNMQTKRSQTVLGLKAGFRIAATGTPIQNHLGELWNLFEFLNPGLLGGRQSFGERFLNPIEQKSDERARRTLKDMIKPFLLRRTKNQVLSDLPEKSEIQLDIEFSTTERAFYEALRQDAVTQFDKLAGKKEGERQIIILAHLMKLRRACCNPSLAGGPDSAVSSKMERLNELLDTIIENGHQTLIFSQFTDHLTLIRKNLEARGIAFEYLDGSTPVKERGARVERFQAGSAPVFLISLQAGGTGLNLTAADYVIHMDPWWNPAVEDQASDRAHRIGQTRPVTIYRLVTKDTIEEKIIQLHKSKRDIADALLEGTDIAARLSASDLMSLIAQTRS